MYSKKTAILGQNPKTKKDTQVTLPPPQGKRLHLCPQEFREKVLLTCNENALKNATSGGKTEAEKDKRIKMKGVKKAKEKYSAKGRQYKLPFY